MSDEAYMHEINRLEGERDHYKRRAELLSASLDDDLDIRSAACQWYDAWKGKSITAMKDANLRLRDAVKKWHAKSLVSGDGAGEGK